MRVILQPGADAVAVKNYNETILKNIKLNHIKNYLSDEEFKILKNIYHDDNIKIWGVVNGKNNCNYKKWEKINPGDIVFFAKNNKLFSMLTVTTKFKNKKLAKSLWKESDDGKLFENIYFLDELKNIDISYYEMNKIIGYSDGYKVQGFSVLDEDKSIKLINALDIKSDRHFKINSKFDILKKLKE